MDVPYCRRIVDLKLAHFFDGYAYFSSVIFS